MASEVFSAREGGVNPINAQGRAARRGSSLSRMKELPEFDVRYEMPTMKKNSEGIEAVFVENNSYYKTSSVRFQPSSTTHEEVLINVPRRKMLGLLKAIEADKDYSVNVSFPRTERNQWYKSKTLSFDFKRREITFEARPKKENERIISRRVPSDAFKKVVDNINGRIKK